MLTAYVNLKKLFDSVHCEAIWDLLRSRRIPAGLVGLLSGLYPGTESAVEYFFGGSNFFPVTTGVR